MPDVVQVTVTIDAEDSASALAGAIVAQRLAACAQVLGPIASTYWWNGSVEVAREWMLVCKTTAAAYPALEEFVRGRHPYDVPEIVAVPVTAGNAAYLAWVAAEVSRPD
jgi:periplasmic divalent cation tolerance protein